MKCPRCQFENPMGMDACLSCDHGLVKDFAFSPALPQPPPSYTPFHLRRDILTRKSALEGERKIVTVLFADVVDSVVMFENRDPEDAHEIMDGCFRILGQVIHRNKGTINQFTGDGVMALFGAPVAQEDHALRACDAALDVQMAISKYAARVFRQFNVRFKMRIGLNSGLVVVGAIGSESRMDYTADGDTTNLASRLEGLASPGKIIVAENVYRRARTQYLFESLGKRKIKGKRERQGIYELVGRRPRRPIDTQRMIRSEMIGRGSELDRLEHHVRMAQRGEGAIVNIVGEAGVGKSRLVAELKRRKRIEDIHFFEGRALNIGQNLSFYPITAIFKAWAGIQENDSEKAALVKLEAAIKGVFPEQSDEICVFVAVMMGFKLRERQTARIAGIEGEALEKLIHKSIADLLSRVTQRSTVVLIIEDLHWSDTSSLNLLTSLFRLTKNHHLLFINVFRPLYNETGERLLGFVAENHPGCHHEIYVQPLDPTQSGRLMDNLLKTSDLSDKLRERIVMRSDGNPFFIEEVIRSLIDRGLVVLKNKAFRLTREVESIVVPSTIKEILQSRIDRLDEDTKSLVKTAAVIGRVFFPEILQSVYKPSAVMDEKLQYLQRIQFVRRRKRRGQIHYIFKHTLMQETAYESILLKNRRELHLKVAESMEKVFDERINEFYGMLAYHYSKGNCLEKAEVYMVKAGREAMNSSGSREALNYYKEALNIYTSSCRKSTEREKVVMFEKNIALAFYNCGQYEEAIRYFDKALNYYWGNLPEHPAVVVYRMVGGILHLLVALYLPFLKFKNVPTKTERDTIELYYKKCQALIILSPRRFFVESFYFYRRFTRFDFTRVPNGAAKFISASALFTFTGLSHGLGQKIINVAKGKLVSSDERQMITHDLLQTSLNYFSGRWDAIQRHKNALVSRNLAIGEVWSASLHYYWHGFPYLYQGNIKDCAHVVERLEEIVMIYGNDLSRLLYFILKTKWLVETRCLAAAAEVCEKGIAFMQRRGFPLSLIDLYTCRISIDLLNGDAEGAERQLKKADKIRSDMDANPSQLCNFFKSQLEYYLDRYVNALESDSSAKSKKYRQRALKSGRQLRKISRKTVQHRTVGLQLVGTCYWFSRQPGKAFKWWRRAVYEGNRIGARLELSRCYCEIGKRLFSAPDGYRRFDGMDSMAYLEKARQMFLEMGLASDLEALEDFTGRRAVHENEDVWGGGTAHA